MIKLCIVFVLIGLACIIAHEHFSIEIVGDTEDPDDSDIYKDCGTCKYNPDGLGCRNEQPHQFYCGGNPPRWECADWKERER